MADADGATKFADIEKMESGLKDLQPKPVSYILLLIQCSANTILLFNFFIILCALVSGIFCKCTYVTLAFLYIF